MLSLFPVRASARDDANDLYRQASFVFLTNGVSHQQKQVSVYEAKRLPALLAVFDAVRLQKSKWIGKGANSRFKADAVLSKIDCCFGGVPFKVHQHYQMLLRKCINVISPQGQTWWLHG